jgi:biotin-dependent carboxylase-like uncharacterized protein
MREVFQVEAIGMRMSVQDLGRVGWARYGVPPSGAMDDHAAAWANRLLNNPAISPVLEILGRGAQLKCVADVWIAVTGAQISGSVSCWRAIQVHAGDVVSFSGLSSGLWTYVAVAGGFDAPEFLGSASIYARGNLGRLLERGDVLGQVSGREFNLPDGISSRLAPWTEQRDYSRPPALRVWPGPQWELFGAAQREQFFSQSWQVSPQSDRAGYRLSGAAMQHEIGELLSEPVMVGTVQVPPNGQPIVTMRDGPTVGGYAKLGVLDATDVSWLAQVQPGQHVRFKAIDAI